MSTTVRLLLAGAVVLALVAVVAPRRGPARAVASAERPAPVAAAARPRMVDLGSVSCVPCKAMKPILAELAREQHGYVDIEFIDIFQRPEAGERYDVRVIPTQVFLDAQGREFARHEGFLSKADILARFQQAGVALAAVR